MDIYTVAADGTDVRRITAHPGSDFTPRWSPDGRHIAFVARRDGADDLYIVDADGGGERRIPTAANRDRGSRLERRR